MPCSISGAPPATISLPVWAALPYSWPLSSRSRSLWLFPTTSSDHQIRSITLTRATIHHQIRPHNLKWSQRMTKGQPCLIPLVPSPSRTSSVSRMNVRSRILVSPTRMVSATPKAPPLCLPFLIGYHCDYTEPWEYQLQFNYPKSLPCISNSGYKPFHEWLVESKEHICISTAASHNAKLAPSSP